MSIDFWPLKLSISAYVNYRSGVGFKSFFSRLTCRTTFRADVDNKYRKKRGGKFINSKYLKVHLILIFENAYTSWLRGRKKWRKRGREKHICHAEALNFIGGKIFYEPATKAKAKKSVEKNIFFPRAYITQKRIISFFCELRLYRFAVCARKLQHFFNL